MFVGFSVGGERGGFGFCAWAPAARTPRSLDPRTPTTKLVPEKVKHLYTPGERGVPRLHVGYYGERASERATPPCACEIPATRP